MVKNSSNYKLKYVTNWGGVQKLVNVNLRLKLTEIFICIGKSVFHGIFLVYFEIMQTQN